jgi:hypothetical protein
MPTRSRVGCCPPTLPAWLQPPLLPWVDAGPAPRHAQWLDYVATPHMEGELLALRRCVEQCHDGIPICTLNMLRNRSAGQTGAAAERTIC